MTLQRFCSEDPNQLFSPVSEEKVDLKSESKGSGGSKSKVLQIFQVAGNYGMLEPLLLEM